MDEVINISKAIQQRQSIEKALQQIVESAKADTPAQSGGIHEGLLTSFNNIMNELNDILRDNVYAETANEIVEKVEALLYTQRMLYAKVVDESGEDEEE